MFIDNMLLRVLLVAILATTSVHVAIQLVKRLLIWCLPRGLGHNSQTLSMMDKLWQLERKINCLSLEDAKIIADEALSSNLRFSVRQASSEGHVEEYLPLGATEFFCRFKEVHIDVTVLAITRLRDLRLGDLTMIGGNEEGSFFVNTRMETVFQGIATKQSSDLRPFAASVYHLVLILDETDRATAPTDR